MNENPKHYDEQMHAAVLHAYGGPEELKFETVQTPQPADDEILVLVASVSINPVDLKMRSGDAKERFPVTFPGVIGRDVSGTVVDVGKNITKFEIGDKVLGLVMHAYAEYAVGTERQFAKKPKEMSFQTASALPLVTLTGSQLASQAAKVESSQTILITGALGGVGRSAVYTALQAGAKVIAGVRANQRQEALDLGVADVIAVDDEADIERLAPYDKVADTLGGDIAKRLVTLVRSGGTFASVLGDPANSSDRNDVTFVSFMAHPDGDSLEKLAEAVHEGKFTIPIGPSFSLKEAALAHATFAEGGHGKVLLIP
jgi:NADPH:quinone reductase-like Zn-dependent oxidoreductase